MTSKSLHSYLVHRVFEVTGIPSVEICDIEREVRFLEERYSEPWRFYHNMEHVLTVLDRLESYLQTLSSKQRRKNLVRAAIYHDTYFLPGSAHNELFSSLLATKYAPDSFSPVDNETIEMLILSTKQPHIPFFKLNNQDDAWALIDADLAGLGQDPENFASDTDAIELEFLAVGVSKSDYTTGRKRWAEDILRLRRSLLPFDNRFVFQSDLFGHLDEQAVRNLSSL